MGSMGGGGGGGGKTRPTTSRQQREFLNMLLEEVMGPSVRGIPQELISGFPRFDQPYPGLSPLEGMSLAGLESMASGGDGGYAGAEQFAAGRSALGDILGRGPRSIEDYFTQTVQDPMMRSFRESTLPEIRGSAVGGGTLFGGQTREQESRATRDLLDSLTRERSRISFEERAREDATKMAAAQVLPQLLGGEEAYLGGLLEAGGVPRRVATEEYTANLATFLRDLEERDRRLALGGQLSTAPTYMAGAASGGGMSGGDISSAAAAIISAAIMASAGACSVVALYYPRYSEEWLNARRWILFIWQGPLASAVRYIYTRHSDGIAEWLSRHGTVRRLIGYFVRYAEKMGRR